MSDWSVDSSVEAKWAVPEVDSAHARRLIDAVVTAGGRLWVLDVGLAEVVNVIWKYYHRHSADLDDARQMLSFLLSVPIHVAPSQPLLPAAFELATKYDCAVYDALFVQLAHDRGLPGLTADEPLWKAVHGDFPQIQLLRLWTPPS
jgi:predicted nucleic acid-binding protein